jgi:hypothetical protein
MIFVEIRTQKWPLGNFAHTISFLLILQIYMHITFPTIFIIPQLHFRFFHAFYKSQKVEFRLLFLQMDIVNKGST